MVCAVCLFIFLWSCDMAGLLRGTFVSWWYLPRIWPPVTDMQHYYPTEDWHLACVFSLIYFSVEVCLAGVFPHSVSIWSYPCVRACAPLMNWRLPSRENNIVQGVTRFSTWAKRGGIWTDARVCLHYWVAIWVAGYCNPTPPPPPPPPTHTHPTPPPPTPPPPPPPPDPNTPTISLSSLCKLICRHWTYEMSARYILSSVWVRLSIIS